MQGVPPLISAVARPWWDALARQAVALQQCRSCAGWVFYPRGFCPHCGGRELTWRDVDATGVLYTWSVAEVPVAACFAHLHRPILAVVELGVGVRVPTTLVEVAADDVGIGMAVSPVFDHSSYPGTTLLRYRPIECVGRGGSDAA